MKLFQFDYKNEISLRGKLHRIRQYCEEKGASKVLFHIFTDSPDKELIDGVCAVLDQEMPDAEYAGCSTNGNISSGDFSPSVYPLRVWCSAVLPSMWKRCSTD